MNKLTTECLEKFVNDIKADGMCDITDHQVELALIRLLAYERAAKNEVPLPEALKYAEIYGRAFICVDRSGSVHVVDPSQITLTILNEPAPALPKQPELLSIGELLHRLEEQTGEKWVEESAQPVIPEQPEFYTKPDRFLPECLKSEEISGGRRNSRIAELMGWFDRYYSGKVNPKWLKAHVAELCYYILTVPQLSAQPVSEPYKLPDGWKLVPIEPTAAMFHAFNDCDYGRKSMRERYIQMIEAAPTQESE